MFDPLAVALPIARYTVTPHGGYAFARNTPADGACGVGEHPCHHWGLDMRPLEGHAWCLAPEDATVRYVDRNASASAAPLGGYGPGSVLLEGRFGFAHVLGHLDPDTIPAELAAGYRVRCGEPVGRIDRGPNHVHWEVRTALLPPRGAARGRLTWHPLRWYAMRQAVQGAAVGAALAKLPLLVVGGLAVAVAALPGGKRAA